MSLTSPTNHICVVTEQKPRLEGTHAALCSQRQFLRSNLHLSSSLAGKSEAPTDLAKKLEWVPPSRVRPAPILADGGKSHSGRIQNRGDSKRLLHIRYSHGRRALWKPWPTCIPSCSWRARLHGWRGTLNKQRATPEKSARIEKRPIQIPACSEDTVKCVSCLYPSAVAYDTSPGFLNP